MEYIYFQVFVDRSGQKEQYVLQNEPDIGTVYRVRVGHNTIQKRTDDNTWIVVVDPDEILDD